MGVQKLLSLTIRYLLHKHCFFKEAVGKNQVKTDWNTHKNGAALSGNVYSFVAMAVKSGLRKGINQCKAFHQFESPTIDTYMAIIHLVNKVNSVVEKMKHNGKHST